MKLLRIHAGVCPNCIKLATVSIDVKMANLYTLVSKYAINANMLKLYNTYHLCREICHNIVVLSDKTTITEKRRLGLTVRDVILLSLGLLLLLLMSLGTLLVWRRKSKRQKM